MNNNYFSDICNVDFKAYEDKKLKCRALIKAATYDKDKKECFEFNYGGCGLAWGQTVFRSIEECKKATKKCHSQ